MIHEDVTTDWVYEHYLIYLYLSIADSDNIISDKELEGIRCKAMNAIEEGRCTLLIKEVYREFRSHSAQEKMSYIKLNAHKYLRTESIKSRVILALESNVGHKEEESEEMVMFRFIRKAINNSK